MRSGVLMRVNPDPEQSETANAYRRNESRYQNMLAEKVPSDFDAVVSPPSRMAWQAEPYRKAIRLKKPSAIDLTHRLKRVGHAFAGENATVAQISEQMEYVPTGHECDIRRLIIVDDTFTRGTTAAATVRVLRAYGLPEDCEIIVACPLWLDTFDPAAETD
jgi:glutamine phosphoribosylpyrophosphate amidotransferase